MAAAQTGVSRFGELRGERSVSAEGVTDVYWGASAQPVVRYSKVEGAVSSGDFDYLVGERAPNATHLTMFEVCTSTI